MESYFIYVNGKRQGPFTLHDLREKNITAHTPIWKDGMKTWTEAHKIKELDGIYETKPPPFVNSDKQHSDYDNRPTAFATATEKTGYSIGKFLGLGGLLILVIIITFFIVYKSQNAGPNSPLRPFAREKTPEELKAELRIKENQTPTSYINHEGTWRKNLLGETVLEGTLSNKATIANFKDIVLNVVWMSKTNTDLKSENFVVYDFVRPGQSIKYKIKTYAPSAVANIRVGVASATPTSN